jgi:hypothetical protein
LETGVHGYALQCFYFPGISQGANPSHSKLFGVSRASLQKFGVFSWTPISHKNLKGHCGFQKVNKKFLCLSVDQALVMVSKNCKKYLILLSGMDCGSSINNNSCFSSLTKLSTPFKRKNITNMPYYY